MKFTKYLASLFLVGVLSTSQALAAYYPNNANGQATSANSSPVVVSSDQSNLPANIKAINGTSISIGQALGTASLPVVLAAPDTVLSASFTRPGNATATVVGNMFANSVTPGSVVPQSYAVSPTNGVPVYITKGLIMIQTSGNAGVTVTGGSFRLHLFGQSPTVGASGGDAAAFSANVALVNWCGTLDGTLILQGTDWSVGELIPTFGPYVECTPGGSSKTVYGLLEARGVFTPPNAGIVQTAITVQ